MLNHDGDTTTTAYMISTISRWLAPFYILLSFTAILSRLVPLLGALASHGKTRTRARTRAVIDLWVSKRCFVHFYLVSLVSMVTVLPEISLARGLLSLHLLRRTYECLFVHQFSANSKMHLAGYLLGVGHYLALPLVFLDATESESRSWWTSAGALFNLWAQYQQYRHHSLLADLRRFPSSSSSTTTSTNNNNNNKKESRNTTAYHLPPPTSGWFRWITCPHYLAEILIYLSFSLILGLLGGDAAEEPDVLDPPPPPPSSSEDMRLERFLIFGQRHCHWFLFLWVTTNLTVSALNNYDWYKRHNSNLTQSALFPFLL
jgi:hypothetical protein